MNKPGPVPRRTWWRSRSVRLRLTLGHIVAIVVVLAAYAAAVFTFVNRSMSDSLDQQLRNDFWWAAAMVDPEPDGTITWYGDESTGTEQDLWLQVWSLDGRLLYRNVQADLNPVPASESLARQAVEDIVSVPTSQDPVRVLTRPVQATGRNLGLAGSDISHPVVIQVARAETAMRIELRELLIILLLGLPVGVAVAGFSGYALAWGAFAPVERMAERARFITAERLGDRLPVDNPNDELGHLATVFNDTLARLEASFEQMRRFTADVSHELRTPLTAIRSVGEVGLRERRSEDEYRGIVGSMLEEVDRLSTLVDKLLTLSRVESGQARLSPEAIDLLDLARRVVSDLGVLAEEKGQSITVEGAGAPTAVADKVMVRQALINLVDNAIKYTPSGGRIEIRVGESASDVVIDVADTGPGIEAPERDRIFHRFQRRSDPGAESHGTGLGLSIARWSVEVNGGRLTLEPSGVGATFRISLPKAD